MNRIPARMSRYAASTRRPCCWDAVESQSLAVPLLPTPIQCSVAKCRRGATIRHSAPSVRRKFAAFQIFSIPASIRILFLVWPWQQARDHACPATSGQAQNLLWPLLRITAVRFPAYLRDRRPQEFEYCTVAGRWLRVAFLLPGAAALAAFLVELAVSGNLVGNAGAIVINTVWYLIGTVAFLFATDNRAARRLLAATSLVVIGYAVGYGLTAHANADWAVVILLQTLGWTFECSVLALFAVFPDGIYQRSYERRIVIAALVLQVPLQIIQLAGSNSLGQPIFASTALRVPDPFFVIQLRSLGPAATALINGFLALSAGGALALLILRYRRFGSQQRHQIRWPFYGIAVAVAWGLLSNLLPSSSGPPTLTDTIIYLGPQVPPTRS